MSAGKLDQALRDEDFLLFINEIGELIRERANIDTLEKIRDLIDDAAFATQLEVYINNKHNSLSPIDIPNALTRAIRAADDGQSKDATNKQMVTIWGGGGSATLVFGSIMATLSLAIPVVALIPLVGGLLVAGTTYAGVQRLDRAQLLQGHIAQTLRAVKEALDEAT
jgi:hypothetical protein